MDSFQEDSTGASAAATHTSPAPIFQQSELTYLTLSECVREEEFILPCWNSIPSIQYCHYTYLLRKFRTAVNHFT